MRRSMDHSLAINPPGPCLCTRYPNACFQICPALKENKKPDPQTTLNDSDAFIAQKRLRLQEENSETYKQLFTPTQSQSERPTSDLRNRRLC